MNSNCLKYGHDWAKIGNYVQCIAYGCSVQRPAKRSDKPVPALSSERCEEENYVPGAEA